MEKQGGQVIEVEKYNCAAALDSYKQHLQNPSLYNNLELNNQEQLLKVFKMRQKYFTNDKIIEQRPISGGLVVRRQRVQDDHNQTVCFPISDQQCALVQSKSAFADIPQSILHLSAAGQKFENKYIEFKIREKQEAKMMDYLQGLNNAQLSKNTRPLSGAAMARTHSGKGAICQKSKLLSQSAIVANSALRQRRPFRAAKPTQQPQKQMRQ